MDPILPMAIPAIGELSWDMLAKPLREYRARQTGAFGESCQRPSMAGRGMDRRDRFPNLRVRQGIERSNATNLFVGKKQPERLQQHQMGEMLGRQFSAWLGFAHLGHHASDQPAQLFMVVSSPVVDRRVSG